MTDAPSEPQSTGQRSGIDFGLWWKILRFSLAYRSRVAALLALAALMALCDVLLPLVTRNAIDAAVAGQVDLRGAILQYLALLGCMPVFIRLFIRQAGFLATHTSHDIRRAGFERLQELSPGFYDRHNSGWLLARMTSDCDRLARIVSWGLLDFVWGVGLMLSIAVVMLVLSPRLALVALAVVPVLVWVSLRFQQVILRSARAMRRSNSRLTAAYSEGISGVRTTKVLARERAALGEFQVLSGEMSACSIENAVQSALYLPVVLSLGSVATGLALWAGCGDVLAGAVSLGTLIAFLHYTGQFFDPINELAVLFASLQTAQAAAERILGLIATEPEIQDSETVRAAVRAHAGAAPVVGRAADGGRQDIRQIRFEGVGFAYPGGKRVLSALDLEVAAGETIALVGPTGAGKSTIVSLLCRFYEPTAGRILVDGVDYRERSLAWLQSQLGMVLQVPHLFSGTIAENIRYGRLEASDDEVEAAARLVRAHDFIVGLPDGYQSRVGEGGSGLSTGQRQLLTFARAILKDPPILVLDEATSSIDTETEQVIQGALAGLLRGRTSFVIAHRLSTIRGADRILFIDQGGIVEQGSHRELLQRGGRYRQLYAEQTVRERVATIGEPQTAQ